MAVQFVSKRLITDALALKFSGSYQGYIAIKKAVGKAFPPSVRDVRDTGKVLSSQLDKIWLCLSLGGVYIEKQKELKDVLSDHDLLAPDKFSRLKALDSASEALIIASSEKEVDEIVANHCFETLGATIVSKYIIDIKPDIEKTTIRIDFRWEKGMYGLITKLFGENVASSRFKTAQPYEFYKNEVLGSIVRGEGIQIISDPQSNGRCVKESYPFIFSPEVADGRLIAAFKVDWTNKPLHSEDEDIRLFAEIILRQAEAAKSRIRRMKEEDKWVAQLTALADITKKINTLDIKDVLQRVVDISSMLFSERAEFAEDIWSSIQILDEESKTLPIAAAKNIKDDIIKDVRLSLSEESIATSVIKSKKPMLINDISELLGINNFKIQGYRKNGSCMVAPLIYQDRVTGTINVGSEKKYAFSNNDLEILIILAGHVATAIENARLYEREAREAKTDGLTGLYNHRTFQDLLGDSLEKEVKKLEHLEEGKLALIMFDIDQFKNYNDSQGHQAGDEVLEHMGKIIKEEAKKIDSAIVARYGGEEFVVVLPDFSKEKAIEFADLIRERMRTESKNLKKGLGTKVTVSAGVSSFPVDVLTGGMAVLQRRFNSIINQSYLTDEKKEVVMEKLPGAMEGHGGALRKLDLKFFVDNKTEIINMSEAFMNGQIDEMKDRYGGEIIEVYNIRDKIIIAFKEMLTSKFLSFVKSAFIEYADMGLYLAKGKGKDKTIDYSEEKLKEQESK
ncbi:MAG: sensor domain-containing diguanylate cyclase [Candidatus Saganbacteria bacterium]|nr:sensor domain-containing diguanylate cyclase [Candidatus Saganbacteria bacterium]